ncbi:MAG: leucine-rich repeat protein [Clostridia bacterium]|nr:leucine-rich repeat protein [Clostridia bacterium]
MRKSIKTSVRILSFVIIACLFLSASVSYSKTEAVSSVGSAITSLITDVTNYVDPHTKNFFDDKVVFRLPSSVSSDDEISVIVKMNVESVMDAYDKGDKSLTISEYADTDEAKAVSKTVAAERDKLVSRLAASGIPFAEGEKYDTVLSGFEVTVKAGMFDALGSLLSDDATLIVGETYDKCETDVVTNYVDVYETGIFNSSDSEYQGDGVVVAVLDTGLDYTHTAFSKDNFTTSIEAFTLETVSGKVGETTASKLTEGLTGEDVYVSKKVPFAYDYADKDPDVLPINSEHGTHVAGVIAGKDSEITGVAPNAQLAIMKVFSDIADGAKTSWILAALEDCVVLGVDVINMSLGTACGFSREEDGKPIADIYDRIGEAGISLIVAASNSYNATVSSKKNGSNGLTSNPDSGTVGSPSTYGMALSVASVNGVKTPYLLYGDRIIYFNEASTSSAKNKNFVDDLLKTLYNGGYISDKDYAEVEYVKIPGIGRSSDYFYDADYYKGKIVLVKRGQTTFEEKIRIALKEKGAAGVIIYNNISGTITMSVGADIGAACSISQDDGEILAEHETGKLIVSRNNVAGPFMSDFSSWGPTSDLKIKPEITAHGGEIYSAVPGQSYDRLSGTSMAAPNQAGATALIRQYVKSGKFGSDITPTGVTAIVNKLMMSTADILLNKNGLPFSVRKQGAGLVNIKHSYQTAAYVTTYDENGVPLDKSKLELGDDKDKTGVYTMTFDVTNVSDSQVEYDVGALVMTEGVSTTYTGHSDRTVSQEGYMLGGATAVVTGVSGGTNNGNLIRVAAGATAKVSLTITLSDKDKDYLDEYFANGMYVEGFVTFAAKQGTTVNMNVPLLAFYGDWTMAPIFDEEYYDTNVDEFNKGLDDDDKLMEDAYATRVIGGLYSDYITTLGSYYFVQDPTATQIPASKDHIALSNQKGDEVRLSVNKIRSIWAGLLRNAKEVDISIVEDATGRVVFERTETNQRKSYSYGGSTRMSTIDVEFDVLEHELKNNTAYTVTVEAFIDFGEKSEQNNKRSVFTFPLYIDFEAPVVTDVTFRTEYDRTSKKTSYFAELSVYDNHYTMAMSLGQVVRAQPGSQYWFELKSFDKYTTPVYSSLNSTSTVSFDITDYIAEMKKSAGIRYLADGTAVLAENTNTFIVTCYDYALNTATYEIKLPDEVAAMYFTEDEISLSPNETREVKDVLALYPSDTWITVLDMKSSDPEVADVVNGVILAKSSGNATVTAVGYDKSGNKISTSMNVKVLAPNDEGYNGTYSRQDVSKFVLTGYDTIKAFYKVNTDDRDIGISGGEYAFGEEFALKMFPSEQVRIKYTLDSYFPEDTKVEFKVGNTRVATVDDNGVLTAVNEGNTILSARVISGGKAVFSRSVAITVKDPYETMSIYLMSYNGDGDENHVVTIPDDRGITTIYSYAFSGYEYVEKDLAAGDVIDEEDPYFIKQMYIGENTIKKIVIPEGVIDIQSYAFAKLTALEEVVLPSSLIRIGYGAFFGCTSLKKINLNNAKFINEKAFYECPLTDIDLSSVVSIGNYTFSKCKLTSVELPKSSQSLGTGAFADNPNLSSIVFRASKIKIGPYAFANCPLLFSAEINAAVVSSHAFEGCTNLEKVKLGKDVSVIGEFAFAGTSVTAFDLDVNNTFLYIPGNKGPMVYRSAALDELILVAPSYAGESTSGAANIITLPATVKTIGTGAFSGNNVVFTVVAEGAETIGNYAFSGCSSLINATLPNVITIGDHAFENTKLDATPSMEHVTDIGAYAFFNTYVTSVAIPDGCDVGEYAFAENSKLTSVTVGNDVTVGAYAFNTAIYNDLFVETELFTGYRSKYNQYTYTVKNADGEVIATFTYYAYDFSKDVRSKLTSLSIGNNVVLGAYAFAGNARLTAVTIGDDAYIGDHAFFGDAALATIDLSKAVYIGDHAFDGLTAKEYSQGETSLDFAYDYIVNGDEPIVIGNTYTVFAPKLTSVDISSATYVGKYAFANNRMLEEVVTGNSVNVVEEGAFYNCTSLKTFGFNENVSSIGELAFYRTALEEADLTNVSRIDKGAFTATALNKVTLSPDGTYVGDGAFKYCTSLNEAENLDKAYYIGDGSFGYALLDELDLSSAKYIGKFAFMFAPVTDVTFGKDLTELGDNPFLGCPIVSFGTTLETTFNGQVVDTEYVDDYNISDSVFVSDGVLYQKIATGNELVTYPMLKKSAHYTVVGDTVRISDGAFMSSAIKTVNLPLSLLAIGDKAFYACNDLNTVVFCSYKAPLLEETYDVSYANTGNYPLTGKFNGFEGLGIVDYYMWNLSYSNATYYFGANFVDHVGKINDKLVMVRPTNGQNYDTFILDSYFEEKVLGAAAPMNDTLKVVKLIEALPSTITLAEEKAVADARAAYDNIPSNEQKALVGNYSNLVSAEQTIEYLKMRDSDDSSSASSSEGNDGGGLTFGQFLKNNLFGFILSFVILCGFGVFAFFTLRGKKLGASAQSGNVQLTGEEQAPADSESFNGGEAAGTTDTEGLTDTEAFPENDDAIDNTESDAADNTETIDN